MCEPSLVDPNSSQSDLVHGMLQDKLQGNLQNRPDLQARSTGKKQSKLHIVA